MISAPVRRAPRRRRTERHNPLQSRRLSQRRISWWWRIQLHPAAPPSRPCDVTRFTRSRVRRRGNREQARGGSSAGLLPEVARIGARGAMSRTGCDQPPYQRAGRRTTRRIQIRRGSTRWIVAVHRGHRWDSTQALNGEQPRRDRVGEGGQARSRCRGGARSRPPVPDRPPVGGRMSAIVVGLVVTERPPERRRPARRRLRKRRHAGDLAPRAPRPSRSPSARRIARRSNSGPPLSIDDKPRDRLRE